MKKTDNALGFKPFLVFDINNQSSSKFFKILQNSSIPTMKQPIIALITEFQRF